MPTDLEFIHRYSLPRCIPINRDWAARLDIFDSSGAVTLTAPGSYSLFYGTDTTPVFTTSALTYGAGFAELTADVPAATLADREPSDRLLERWSVTTLAGVREFTRPCSLVRNELHSVITDADLFALHSDLADLRDPDQTNFESQITDAWVMLNKWLIQKGNRPQLIIDDWMLRDVHRYMALHIIFSDFATSVGDGRYSTLAAEYQTLAAAEFERITFRYDTDQDGLIGEGEVKAANPVTFLSVPWGWSC